MFYIISVFISVIILIGLTINAWNRRDVVGGIPFAIIMALGAFWMFGIGIMVTRTTPEAALIWYRLQFLSVTLMPVALTIFVIVFHGHEKWLNIYKISLLSLIPLITLLIVWTDEFYPLFFEDITIVQKGELMLITSFEPGIWFNLFSAHNYAISLFSIGWLIMRAVRQFSLYRRQSIAIIVGTLAVLLPNVLFSFNLLPPDVSVLPFGFLLMGVLISWSMFNDKLLDVVPVARNKLVDSMSDCMMLIDVQGRIVDLNAAMFDFLMSAHPDFSEKSLREIIGQPAAKILKPWQQYTEQFVNEDNVQVEITLDVAGQKKYWDLRISLVKGRRNEIGGQLIVMRDITSRVNAETVVREAIEAAEMAIETLRVTNAEFAANNAELEAYAHTVAHDLKVPLSNIVSFSDLIISHWDRFAVDEIQTYLRIISREGAKSVRIVEELLLLSSIRQNDEVELSTIDMGLIVKDVLARLQKMIDNYGAEGVVHQNLKTSIGYQPWIEEVWMNYVSNALKYGGEPPRFEIGATVESGGFVRYWIKDNGPGLSKEEQAMLFTPFTRLHQSRAEGHGLGLSIVQRIVEKLGGQVGVESQVGEGSTFFFTLPSAELDESVAI